MSPASYFSVRLLEKIKMFDEIAKAKDIFWEKFQGTGMSHEIFDVLFDSSIDKLKRDLTSKSSGRSISGCQVFGCCHRDKEGHCMYDGECPHRRFER